MSALPQSSFVTTPTPQPYMQSDVDVTVELVRTIISEHESGSFYTSGILADELDRNPRIRGALDARIRGILGTESYLQTPDHVKDDPLAVLITGAASRWWHSRVNEAVLEGLLRNHITMGFAIAEVAWEVHRRPSNEGVWEPALYPWHPSTAHNDNALNSMCVYDAKGKLLQVRPGDNRWLMLSATAKDPWMRGVIRCTGLEDTLRVQATRDWARWSEKHGIPITKAYVPRDEIASVATKGFLRALRMMGRQGHIKLPMAEDGKKLYDVEFAEMKAMGWEGFERLIKHCDTDVSIAILGQNLTTEVTGGSLAAARVHDDVKLDIVKADAEMLSTCLREHVLKPWVRLNYGAHLVELAPWPRWHVEPPANLESSSKVLVAVMTAIETAARAIAAGVGVPLDVRALLEQYEIPTTPEVEQFGG